MIIYKHTCIRNVMLVLFYAKVPFKNLRNASGGEGSVTSVMHIMHINEYKAWGVGGLKNWQKKCYVIFEWPPSRSCQMLKCDSYFV